MSTTNKKGVELTKRQEEILEFIKTHIEKSGFPPTISEIQEEFSFKSPNAVQEHVKALARKGCVRRNPNKWRGLEVVGTSKNRNETSRPSTVAVPLIGRVAAGSPILAEENIEEYLAFPRSMIPEGSIFALRVVGDSMKDAGIFDGDIAVIKKQDIAQNGDIVVALIDDEATLKYFYKDKKRVRLQPANKAYKPIFSQNVTIVGVLSGIYRTF